MVGGSLVQRVLSLAPTSHKSFNRFVHQAKLPDAGGDNAPERNTLMSTAVIDVSGKTGGPGLAADWAWVSC